MSTQPVFIITGASSGIGEASTRAFSEAGFRVVAVARRMDRLKALANETNQDNETVLPLQADIRKLEDIEIIVRTSLEYFGQIDGLVNNAGIGRFAWLEALPVEDIEDQVRTNLLGVIYASRAVLPHMIQRRTGVIINVASIASFMGTPTYTLYAASKYAVRGFTEALRREVGIYGIRVCGIYPGSVENDFAYHARIVRKTGLRTPKALRLSSEAVAEAILGLARRPKRMWVMPRYMNLIIWANRLMPGMIDWAVERRFVRKERD